MNGKCHGFFAASFRTTSKEVIVIKLHSRANIPKFPGEGRRKWRLRVVKQLWLAPEVQDEILSDAMKPQDISEYVSYCLIGYLLAHVQHSPITKPIMILSMRLLIVGNSGYCFGQIFQTMPHGISSYQKYKSRRRSSLDLSCNWKRQQPRMTMT